MCNVDESVMDLSKCMYATKTKIGRDCVLGQHWNWFRNVVPKWMLFPIYIYICCYWTSWITVKLFSINHVRVEQFNCLNNVSCYFHVTNDATVTSMLTQCISSINNSIIFIIFIIVVFFLSFIHSYWSGCCHHSSGAFYSEPAKRKFYWRQRIFCYSHCLLVYYCRHCSQCSDGPNCFKFQALQIEMILQSKVCSK